MERKYTKHIGRSGRIWLVPVGEFAGDNIHVAADPAENAKGYQGVHGFVKGVLVSHNACASHKLGWNNGDPEDEFAKAHVHPST